jgi:hypothetical protein
MASDKSPEVKDFDQQTTIGQKTLLSHSQASKIKIEYNTLTVKIRMQLPTDTRTSNMAMVVAFAQGSHI